MERKVIILDFDGTVYSGEDIFCHVPEYIEKNRRRFLNKLSDVEFEKVCSENPDYMNAVSGAEICKQTYIMKEKYPTFNIDMKGFTDCQEAEVYNICLDNAHITSVEDIDEICSKYPVYVVSNSAINHIHFYMKKFGFDIGKFKKIFSNQFEEFDQSKKHYYEYIIKEEGILPSNLYVYGDSLKSDLNPAMELGANAYLSKDAHELKNLIFSTIED